MDLLAQTALMVALTGLGMGLSVVSRHQQNRLFTSFSLVCGVVFFWSLFFFLERVFPIRGFYSAHILSGIWLSPACLLFIRVWIGRFPQGWILKLSELLWFLSRGLAILLTLVWIDTRQQVALESSFLRDIMYFSPAPVVIQLLIILVTRRPLSVRESFVFIGALVVLAISTMDHVPQMGIRIPSLGNLILCIYLILLGQAIHQQKLLDFPLLITRFIVLLVLALLVTGIYLLLFSWIEKNPLLLFLNSFAVSFLIVMLLSPLQRSISSLTESVLRFRDEKWRLALDALASQLRSSHSLEAWELLLQSKMGPALNTCSLRVQMIHRDDLSENALLVGEVTRRNEAGRMTILVDTLLDAEIQRTSNSHLRTHLQQVREQMNSLNCSAILPIFDGQFLGWILTRLTANVSGERRTPEFEKSHGFRSWWQLRQIQDFLNEVGKSLGLLVRIRDEAEKERLATLGEMAAGLAHEIRNPLGAIQGAAQLLPDTREYSSWARVIQEEVARLNHVVSQFLLFARKSAPDQHLTDMASWLSRSVERLTRGVYLSSVGESLRVSSDLKAWSQEKVHSPVAMIDAEAMFQVLENLVRNSGQAGATEVSIEAGLSPDLRQLWIDVIDNGRGIKKENLTKVFTPFFTTSSIGTGLGLSICKRIVESHHGKIEVLWSEKPGSNFRVRIPQGERRG